MLNSFHKLIWQIGCNIRNPNYKRHYFSLKVSERFSLGELKDLQLNQARNTLIFAYENSRFYYNKFTEVSFDPRRDLISLESIKHIPAINKGELIANNTDVHVSNQRDKGFLSETSGSTGQSLRFRKDENWDSFNRAARARGFSWYEVEPWERNGYLWGYSFTPSQRIKTAILDELQNRFRIFSYKDKEILRFAKRLNKTIYLSGYSSMIYEIARRINEKRHTDCPVNLKMVCGTSEKIYDSYQEEVKNAFGKKIIAEYGAAEAGVIAFECPYGNMHINMEGVIVEEENEEIIVTNLIARSFPVIRYKLGDYVKLADAEFECPCGMKHQVIKNVLGRVGKPVFGQQHNYPSLVFYYVFKNLASDYGLLLNYQVFQEKKGELLVRIQQELTAFERERLNRELFKYFKNDATWVIKTNQRLHQMDGKFRDFVTRIE